jgi:flagellar basal-body rod protein FlgG
MKKILCLVLCLILGISLVACGEGEIAEGEKRPGIILGYVETSDVNVINEMVQMIEVQRLYEPNQKAIQSHDNLLSKAINQAGVARG